MLAAQFGVRGGEAFIEQLDDLTLGDPIGTFRVGFGGALAPLMDHQQRDTAQARDGGEGPGRDRVQGLWGQVRPGLHGILIRSVRTSQGAIGRRQPPFHAPFVLQRLGLEQHRMTSGVSRRHCESDGVGRNVTE
ncbi:hypothetical protein ABZ249_14110 [Nocardiopsis sp. NPDC006139]|uniref:hypothetical protein n=1 Tax=Nocardiopsis sp. NPDC006139 TaxID=3154578 RepID=UPI0033B19F91